MSSKSFYLKPSMYQLFGGAKNVLTKEECDIILNFSLENLILIPSKVIYIERRNEKKNKQANKQGRLWGCGFPKGSELFPQLHTL